MLDIPSLETSAASELTLHAANPVERSPKDPDPATCMAWQTPPCKQHWVTAGGKLFTACLGYAHEWPKRGRETKAPRSPEREHATLLQKCEVA